MKDSIDCKKTSKRVMVDSKNTLDDDEVIDVDLTACEICSNSDREECMLLCDGCNRGYHLYCLNPPLADVPQGSWYCDNCFSSEENDSENEVAELIEDVRDMGEPSSRLRTNVSRAPRITRTRQSERIRAAVITRISRNRVLDPQEPSTSSGYGSIIDTITRRISQRQPTIQRRVARRTKRTKRRRRRVKKTVVEYDINNENVKFPVEVTSRVVKRRKRKTKRRCRTTRSATQSNVDDMIVTTRRGRPDLLSAVPKLHILGNNNQLDYFSSDNNSDDENGPSSSARATNGSTLVTSVIRPRIGSTRLLNRQKTLAMNLNSTNLANNSPIDLLSSIMETQDRWHATSSKNCKIAPDGKLFLQKQDKPIRKNVTPIKDKPESESNPISVNPTDRNPTEVIPSNNPIDINPPDVSNPDNVDPSNTSPVNITQAPMYPRGGGRGGGGAYNNRGNYYNNNNSGGFRRDSSGGAGASNFRGNYNAFNNSSTGSGSSAGGFQTGQNFGNNSNFNQGGMI